MATTIYQGTVTIPSSTPIDSPYSAPITIPQCQITSVDLEVLSGPMGLMGFHLAYNGVQLIPWTAGEWLVWNDHYASWPLDSYPTTGQWVVVGYNLDVLYNHDVTVRFHTDPLAAPAPTSTSITVVTTAPTSVPLVLA